MGSIFTHERINTALALVGLAIASVSAWYQFGPDPDELKIEVEGKVAVGNIETVRKWNFLESAGVLIGPVAWKFVVYNPLDRPVSVVGIDVFYIPKDSLVKYTDLLSGVTVSSTNSAMNFPVTLASREATAFNLSLNIPAEADEESVGYSYKRDRGMPLREGA